jgi:hypothetical protein
VGTRRTQRLRYNLQRDTVLQGTVLRIFLSAVEHCLRDSSPAVNGFPEAALLS